MASLEWVVTLIGIAIALGLAGIWADLFAPPTPIEVSADRGPDALCPRDDWQTVWQMYVGAQYL